MLHCVCRTCRSQFSPLTRWDMGIELRLANLVASTFQAETFQSSSDTSSQMFRAGTCFPGQFLCPAGCLARVPAATHSIVVVPPTSSGIKKTKRQTLSQIPWEAKTLEPLLSSAGLELSARPHTGEINKTKKQAFQGKKREKERKISRDFLHSLGKNRIPFEWSSSKGPSCLAPLGAETLSRKCPGGGADITQCLLIWGNLILQHGVGQSVAYKILDALILLMV